MITTGEKGLYPLGDTDYAVPPGETLRELLEERGMSQRELARRTGLSLKHVNKLLHGLVPLSADVALRLERVTGTPGADSGTGWKPTTGQTWNGSGPSGTWRQM